jgi:hypothetical protein
LEKPRAAATTASTLPQKGKKGTISPQDLPSIRKYGENLSVDILAETIKKFVIRENWNKPTSSLDKTFANLIGGSLASKTWKKYASAWSAWENFLSQQGGGELDFMQEKGWAFICWCKKGRKLKAETLKQYLGAIEKIWDLMASLRNTGNTGSVNQKRSLRKILLMGYKNMEKGRKKHTPVKPINLTILQQIRRNLNSTKIGRGTRLAIWAASLLAFWGSFRLAEILPSRRLAFDKFSDLLWNDIQWK